MSVGISTRRRTCRLCDGKKLVLVLSLKPTPPANGFLTESKLNRKESYYPLDLYFCGDCKHVQILDVLEPKMLFGDYVYVSGTSEAFVQHFQEYADHIISRYELSPNSLVVDIGSNDGTLLKFFKKSGMDVLGIDPATKIAASATESGIETWPQFFSPSVARKVLEEKGKAKIITANNVFAHSDNLVEILEGVKILMELDSLFIFEVSYLLDVFEKSLFDTIYHEHLAYHSVGPLKTFFEKNGMTLIEAKRVSPHGGSLRGVVQLQGGNLKAEENVQYLISKEVQVGLHRPETLIKFGSSIEKIGKKVGKILHDLKIQGKSISGFGAPAKSTTLMHHFNLGPDIIDFIVDDNPFKQGLFTPGFHIPILPTDTIYAKRPDYLIVLAWNFSDTIITNHSRYLSEGGRFIVPLPKIRLV